MCGLVGMAGPGILQRDIEFFKDLLLISQFRGRDSTGVAVINSNKKKSAYTIRKVPESASEFLSLFGSRGGYLNDSYSNIFIGHTRWATVGEVNHQNSHPFDIGNIIGAHNGTLVDYEFFSKTKTDSEMMFAKINREGFVKTLEGLSWRSVYAISAYMKSEKLLVLATNGERPLHVAFNDERSVMYWASELRMLDFVANRSRDNRPTEKLTRFTLSKNYLYVIDPNDISKGNHTPWEAIKIKDAWEDYQASKEFDASSTFDMETYLITGDKTKTTTIEPEGNVIALPNFSSGTSTRISEAQERWREEQRIAKAMMGVTDTTINAQTSMFQTFGGDDIPWGDLDDGLPHSNTSSDDRGVSTTSDKKPSAISELLDELIEARDN